jgi:uncharacterized protein (DUF1697 family)
MKYVALLRGINVGGNRKVEMKKLKQIFEGLDFKNVSTYINSGNVIFESEEKEKNILDKIEKELEKQFGDKIPVLIKSVDDLKKIVKNIPKDWKNDDTQKTDVAYLFPKIDNEKILEELPVKKDFIEVKYVKGVIVWNVKRENYNKSHLNKIISHKLYKFMTISKYKYSKIFSKFEVK